MSKSSHKMLRVSDVSEWSGRLWPSMRRWSLRRQPRHSRKLLSGSFCDWTGPHAVPRHLSQIVWARKGNFFLSLTKFIFPCHECWNQNSLHIFCIGEVRRPQISCRSKDEDMDLELQICKTLSRNPRCNIEQARKSSLPNGSSLLFTSLQILDFAKKKFVMDNTGYIRWLLMCLGTILCSNASPYQLSYFRCVFFLFFFPVEICLRFLRFAVPAGNNKLQTCFLSSNPTFAAPSLWHRPYHYPLKQQKCFCNLGVGGISPAVSSSAASFRHHCGGGFHWLHKNTKEKSTLAMNALVLGGGEGEQDSLAADWQPKAGWKDFERSCCLIKTCTLT